jgi:hypothetical protein
LHGYSNKYDILIIIDYLIIFKRKDNFMKDVLEGPQSLAVVRMNLESGGSVTAFCGAGFDNPCISTRQGRNNAAFEHVFAGGIDALGKIVRDQSRSYPQRKPGFRN